MAAGDLAASCWGEAAATAASTAADATDAATSRGGDGDGNQDWCDTASSGLVGLIIAGAAAGSSARCCGGERRPETGKRCGIVDGGIGVPVSVQAHGIGFAATTGLAGVGASSDWSNEGSSMPPTTFFGLTFGLAAVGALGLAAVGALGGLAAGALRGLAAVGALGVEAGGADAR